MKSYQQFSRRNSLHRSALIMTLLLALLGNLVASAQDYTAPTLDSTSTASLVYLPLVSGGTQNNGRGENESHYDLVIPDQYIVVLKDTPARAAATGSGEV